MQKDNSYSQLMLEWFNANKRDLPFRKTKDPYHIWLSEIMAQQTQIDTLIPYYNNFITLFPTVSDLANASEATVLKAWEGLGYYSRAKNLHKAAKEIVNNYNGIFPNEYSTIIKLPGIGPYTGGAIASIAFKQKVAAVDGNVLRVITRYNNWEDDISLNTTKKKIEEWVCLNQPDISPGDFNESLMELGALICTPKKPKCMICPVNKQCKALLHNKVDIIPIKTKKIKQKTDKIEVGLIYYKDLIYIEKRPENGLLANLWQFPNAISHKHVGEAIKNFVDKKFKSQYKFRNIGKDKHVFSHIVWDIQIFEITIEENLNLEKYQNEKNCFIAIEELNNNYALPVAFSKLLKHNSKMPTNL